MHISVLACLYKVASPPLKAKLRVLNKQTLDTFPVLERNYLHGTGRHQHVYNNLMRRLRMPMMTWIVRGTSNAAVESSGLLHQVAQLYEVWRFMCQAYESGKDAFTQSLPYYNITQLVELGSHFRVYLHRMHPALSDHEFVSGMLVGRLGVSQGMPQTMVDAFLAYADGFMTSLTQSSKRHGLCLHPKSDATSSRLATLMRQKIKKVRFKNWCDPLMKARSRKRRLARRAIRRGELPNDDDVI